MRRQISFHTMIGTRLAHYEITSHLGSGGMGDVYQATDTKLGRSVAIKFLPDAFSHDTERVARFGSDGRVAGQRRSCVPVSNEYRFFRLLSCSPGGTGMTPSPLAKALKGVWSGLAVLVLLSALPVLGSTITVTNTSDSGPGSLRNAIDTANSGDTINFSVTTPATITLTTPLTIDSSGSKSLTIAGPGASSLAISGGNSVPVFVIQPLFGLGGPVTVTISGLTIENGSSLFGAGIFNGGTLTLTDSIVSNNQLGTQFGAGIYNVGTLTLTNTTVSENVITHSIVGGGAGIDNDHGTLTLINSSVSRNFAVGDGAYEGGGILNHLGLVNVANSVVSDNVLSSHAGGDARGAGIANVDSGSLIVTNSTVSGNSVDSIGSDTGGGGISNGIFPRGHGSVRLVNSTVSGNSVQGPDGGGGLLNGGLATVINSTISGNSATFGGSGGGIFNKGFGTIRVTNTTISGNSAGGLLPSGRSSGGIFNVGTATVKNSIVANNSGGNCAVTLQTTTSEGHNLSDEGTCAGFFIQTGDLNNTPAGLDPAGLKNNGGPTQTIGLLATSPAVDAITLSPTNDCTDVSGNPVTTDQRSVTRPQGPACDIGAFEFFQSPFQLEAVQT
jgi:hypothetical protein